ncbi:MAG TPA: hypothetical protein VFJ17_06985 [Mycobacteriales bacterium]|jgi:hypothetical protein|nr:hypothetical protein [Mycobacteriales bacterium]
MTLTTSKQSAPSLGAPIRPSRWRFVAVLLLPLTAVAAIVMWGFAVNRAVSAEANGFSRGPLPGVVTVDGHPGTWTVYAERGTITGVRVADAAGEIPVTMTAPRSAGYDQGGTEATRVATFRVEPGRIGTWRVAVTGSSEGDGQFAVGEFDIGRYMRIHHAGMVALLVTDVAIAVAIAVVPAVRYRRLLRAQRKPL